MLEVKVTIEGPAFVEAINNLARAIAGDAPRSVSQVVPPAPQQAAPAMNPPEATQATAPAQQPTTASAPATSAPTPVAPAQPQAASYTLEQISNAGAALVEQGKMAQVIAILQSHGVQTVSQLNPSLYGAVAEELKALGAQL